MDERLFYCGVSLLSACSWALGAILWRRLGEHLSSCGMNLGKTVLGTLLLGVMLLFLPLEPVSLRATAILVASGLIGIAVGDTFFFRSLLALGPRRASLMGALNPVAIALAAAALLGERPGPMVWGGIVTTACGVSWVLWERASTDRGAADSASGIRYGLLSLLCTTTAVLLAKIGVVSVPPAQAAWIRLCAGSAGLGLWGASSGQLESWVAPFRNSRVLAKTVTVVVVVVVGGFWLSLEALRHIDASVAGTLNATSPLFILPLSMVLMGEKVSPRAAVGTAIAVAGVALILRG